MTRLGSLVRFQYRPSLCRCSGKRRKHFRFIFLRLMLLRCFPVCRYFRVFAFLAFFILLPPFRPAAQEPAARIFVSGFPACEFQACGFLTCKIRQASTGTTGWQHVLICRDCCLSLFPVSWHCMCHCTSYCAQEKVQDSAVRDTKSWFSCCRNAGDRQKMSARSTGQTMNSAGHAAGNSVLERSSAQENNTEELHSLRCRGLPRDGCPSCAEQPCSGYVL